MKSAFPFGGRCEVGFSAISKQARARGKYRIERNARPLQGNRSEKGDIEVGSPSRAELGHVQGLYRIECTKRASPISRLFQVPVDLFRQYGLMVPVVQDQHRPPGRAACQPGSERLPGRRGLCKSRV